MSQIEIKSWLVIKRKVLPKLKKLLLHVCIPCFLFFVLIGCTPPSIPVNTGEIHESPSEFPASTSTPQIEPISGNLTPDQISTLSSLEKIDDYPLYTMNYQGFYNQQGAFSRFSGKSDNKSMISSKEPAWACSLFAALGTEEEFKFGRNFDWEYSPGLLLFTNPPGGYDSVSMVDIAYLDFEIYELVQLEEMELAELTPLLDAPYWPFDGMNEHGLAIGMAAVPSAQLEFDPQKMSVGSLEIMRLILDNAADIQEAVSIMDSYNIDFQGGPDLHYLIADQSGNAVLIEFFNGEMQVIPNDNPWHQATNFLFSANNETQGQCARYDKISKSLTENDGNLGPEYASELLSSVSQNNTQWSVVYNLHTRDIHVIMGRQFEQSHKFQLYPDKEN
jgi:choloylglycine hydrolase